MDNVEIGSNLIILYIYIGGDLTLNGLHYKWRGSRIF